MRQAQPVVTAAEEEEVVVAQVGPPVLLAPSLALVPVAVAAATRLQAA